MVDFAADPLLAWMADASPAHVDWIIDEDSGLYAVLVLDDLRLGPAAGGIRTARYPDLGAALQDALQLARAMTLKCALGGLAAGGGKCVVLNHPGLRRSEAFRVLGQRLAHWEGSFRTAGDLGTTAADLREARQACPWVHVDEGDLGLAPAVGSTVVSSIRAALGLPRRASLDGVTVGVQGAGAIGTAVAVAAHDAGARVSVADLDPARARGLASRVNGELLSPEAFPTWSVDVLCPCAAGGVVTHQNVRGVRATAVVGGANRLLASEEVERALVRQRIAYVPDVVSSSGAVIVGICKTWMEVDPAPLLDEVWSTARRVLELAADHDGLATRAAEAWAERVLRATEDSADPGRGGEGAG